MGQAITTPPAMSFSKGLSRATLIKFPGQSYLYWMGEISFIASFGDETKRVKLTQPQGAGGGHFLSIDNYHKGQLIKQGGQWVLQANDLSEFTADDIVILGDIIENGVPWGLPLAFDIEIMLNRRHLFRVEMVRGKSYNIFRVTGRNTIVLQSNLPMLLARGLKHKRSSWKLVEGLIHNMAAVEKIELALEARSRAEHGAH
jgi:hypothetical protein